LWDLSLKGYIIGNKPINSKIKEFKMSGIQTLEKLAEENKPPSLMSQAMGGKKGMKFLLNRSAPGKAGDVHEEVYQTGTAKKVLSALGGAAAGIALGGGIGRLAARKDIKALKLLQKKGPQSKGYSFGQESNLEEKIFGKTVAGAVPGYLAGALGVGLPVAAGHNKGKIKEMEEKGFLNK
jgi:hypothetical protein